MKISVLAGCENIAQLSLSHCVQKVCCLCVSVFAIIMATIWVGELVMQNKGLFRSNIVIPEIKYLSGLSI